MATDFWDKLSAKYAAQKIGDLPAYEQTLDKIRAILKPEDRVLEIGCGTGSTALILARSVAHYTATDISNGMLGFARAKLTDDAPQNLTFIQAPSDQVLDHDPFDAIIASSILHLVPDLPKTLGALHHQLKPGGLLITKTSCVAEMNPIIRIAIPLLQWIGKAPYVNFLTRDQLAQSMEQAGFEILEVRTFGTSKYVPFVLAKKGQ